MLWASEGRIYQRFGYGMASKSAGLTVYVREVSLRTPRSAGGTVRAVLPAEARLLMPRRVRAEARRPARPVEPG